MGASARQGIAQLHTLRKRILQITTDQIEELRREAVRLPGNASDARLQSPDRIALLQEAVDRQRVQHEDPEQLVRSLIHKRIGYSACFGGIFALPGMVPGIGTVAQFVFGFATTFPETDLVRNQMWCLYVELSHVYGRSLRVTDLEFLREEWKVLRNTNRGEEAFKHAATRQMGRWLSHTRLQGNLQQMLLRLGLPETTVKAMGRSVARGAPFALGMMMGATVNAYRVHRFAQSVLRVWHVEEASDSLSIWDAESKGRHESGAALTKGAQTLA